MCKCKNVCNTERKFKMTKAELVSAMAEKTGLTNKDAAAAVNAFTESVKEALIKGDKVQLVGFGTFEVAERAARMGRNPSTGESIQIAASKTAKWKPSSALKSDLN